MLILNLCLLLCLCVLSLLAAIRTYNDDKRSQIISGSFTGFFAACLVIIVITVLNANH